jgi:zinc/manganese transport system substrate-binding protein
MSRLFQICLIFLGLVFGQTATANLSIFACEPEWASLAEALGGEKVKVVSATSAHQDPHRIEARPSLIAKLRRANLLVCSGAELEIGWLPMLQRQAGNPRVMPGKPGDFEAAMQVERLDIPETLDRSMGDVHASGNPHVHLDPRRLLKIAASLSERMQTLDAQNASYYQSRHTAFSQRMQTAIQRWQEMAQALRGKRFVVHHRDWAYLFDWLGIIEAGSLEPKPGLPTSATHLATLKKSLLTQPTVAILHTHYQSPRASQRLSELTGIKVVELPYTVGGAEDVEDLFSLYEVTLKRLVEAME